MPSPESRERSTTILSCILFALSSYWTSKKLGEEKETRFKHQRAMGYDDSIVAEGKVAKRCARALGHATPYLEAFLMGLQYPCDATHPDGYIPFCIAENKLATGILAERLIKSKTFTQTFSDETVYGYNSFLGIPVARQAVAYFVAKRFLFPNVPTITPDQALASINPNHIGIGSGAAGILNSLFFLLGDEGDACLIPTPYYAAFENDMSVSVKSSLKYLHSQL
jgi:1-aminocyclopropane-1-carboxylate synthase